MNVEVKELEEGFISILCTNKAGLSVTILNLGGIIQSVCLPTGEDIVLGYDTPEEYLEGNYYMGAMIGRYANRIGDARFNLDGMIYLLDENDGAHSLHGGFHGLHTKLFHHRIEGDKLILSRDLPEGEDGYPGNLAVEIHYELTDENALSLEYFAKTDADTIINLTNHSYFNLDGVKSGGNCLSHTMALYSDMFTVNDSEMIPTGEMRSVFGTPLDFNNPKKIGDEIEEYDMTMEDAQGYDHNFIINEEKIMDVFAIVEGELCGMTVLSDCPCVQFYTANFMKEHIGKNKVKYGKQAGFCLETGMYPNAINMPTFPSPIVKAGETWNYKTTFQFSLK